MPSYDTNKGAKAARDARTAWGLDAGARLECVVAVAEERAGVPVLVVPLPDGFAGAYVRHAGGPLVFISAAGPPVRRRFSVAHELGHHQLGHATKVDRWNGMRIGDSHPDEVQANAFAAELLVPRAALERAAEELLEDRPLALDAVVLLATLFGVSSQMLRYRLETCGLVEPELAGRLDREIAAEEHLALAAKLDLPALRDAIAALEPGDVRVPPAYAGARDAVAALFA